MNQRNNRMSRRDLLKGLGLGALSLGVLPLSGARTLAQISPAADRVVYYQFMLGNFNMTVISDAAFSLPLTTFGANQSEEDVVAFFEAQGLPTAEGTIPTTILNLVLQDGERTVVFDTGNGGRLPSTIDELGIGTDNVTDVIISHFHPDHVNGLSNEGTLTYPNAQVHFPQPEFDFMEANPEPAANALAKLQPALDADMVSFYGADAEITGGVQAIATHGHTPGHMSFRLESDGSQLIHIVDAALNAFASVQNPDWSAGFDAIPDQAMESRRMILGMAADDLVPVMGYHFPFPGIGYINRQDDGFSFQPLAF